MSNEILSWSSRSLSTLSFPGQGQPETKVPRIGLLGNTGTPCHEVFLRRLREMGYVEGQNLSSNLATPEAN
jgi:hypothetical protein